MKRRDLVAAAAGALVATVLAGGLAWAAIPGVDGVIHGCYAKKGGALRVLDTGQSCDSRTELALDWSQKGPKGDTGNTGPTGPPGPKGDKGDQGLQGVAGKDGVDGVGVESTALDPGDKNCPDGGSQFTAAGDNITFACSGAPGANGLDGAKGDKGDPGLRYRAAWNPFGDYPPGDVVVRDGSSWVATEYACCGDEPGVSDKWSLLATKGEDGTPGQDGTNGAPGISGYQVVRLESTVDPGQNVNPTVDCPSGKHLLGGGAVVPGGAGHVIFSGPSGDSQWEAAFHNDLPTGSFTLHVFTYAICAFVQS